MRGTEATITVNGGLEIRTELDPARQAFLDDHRIDGTPVLPGVMGMEAFAETAARARAGLRRRPRSRTSSCRRRSSSTATSRARSRSARSCATTATGGARGRLPADRPADARERRRAGDACTSPAACGSRASRCRRRTSRRRRRSRWARSSATTPSTASTSTGRPTRCSSRRTAATAHVLGRMADDLPPHYDAGAGPTQIVPRLIELCFQTAGVWELGTAGVHGAADARRPRAAVRRRGRAGPPRPPSCRPRPDGTAMDADVVDEHGAVRIRLEGYRTTALPGAVRRGRARAAAAPSSTGRRRDAAPVPPPRRRQPRRGGDAAHPRGPRDQRRRAPSRSRSIALYTEPERQAMFVRQADEAYCLGPATAVGADGRRRNGYLDHAALERALVATRADAVWPGWGFVAEDPAFVDLCERLGIVFVGPERRHDAPPRRQDRGQAARRASRRAGRARGAAGPSPTSRRRSARRTRSASR